MKKFDYRAIFQGFRWCWTLEFQKFSNHTIELLTLPEGIEAGYATTSSAV